MNAEYPELNQPADSADSTKLMSRFVLISNMYVDPDTLETDKYAGIERLHAVREAWDKLTEVDTDYYVGLVAFGSSVKGRFKKSSDIDLMMFVDPSRDVKSINYQDMQLRADDPRIQLAVRYGRIVKDRLGGKGSDHPIRLDGVKGGYPVIIISEQTIKQDITDIVDQRNDTSTEEYFVGRKAIFAPFLMRVGKGKIPEYRKIILDEISNQPDPDLFWKAIAEQVLLYEEKNRGAKIHFPQTLEEAYKYFGIESL